MQSTAIRGGAAPETKSAGDDVAVAFDEFMRTFEAFRQSNDERLAQLEQQSGADPVTTEKMDRIDRALDQQRRKLDELALKGRRPSPVSGAPLAASEHKQAFHAYVRHGRETELLRREHKAMSYGSDPDGGFLVPDETAAEIGRR